MITLIIFNALWIIGVSTLLTWNHSIFEVMRNRDEYPMWAKPLFACWPCMASVHGIPVALWAYGIAPFALIHVICLHGLLACLSVIISRYDA